MRKRENEMGRKGENEKSGKRENEIGRMGENEKTRDLIYYYCTRRYTARKARDSS